MVVRFLLSGTVVASAFFLGIALGPEWGGIFSSFPVISILSFTLLGRSFGAEGTLVLTEPLLVGTMLNTGVYALAVQVTYPLLGILTGTILSYICALTVAYILYAMLRRS